ncbi:hypothetical protein BCV69DRAFT_297061 [Microstroma glucosiphilum]|uniref:Wings apart-like protein C-terminal domain-containing protein n=1 Tax=Pseudomicrostroma glucosiphilum TaxID=1684307 RepID=A0A316UDY6_9BASI|nr:hypothetical protein BCV69DRAFT_297061 [Pseudomicrostroma glucosiphilum]PWN23108.1 hypothetical protein BCV69DRAFT_297061 [Pseudomicrostroma glucosiphilum]
MTGSEEGTPRRARATYGARTKRPRRLRASSKGSEEASDLEESGAKQTRNDSDSSPQRRLRSSKKVRHLTASGESGKAREILEHGAALSPSANRFTTPPPPPLSQEIAQAFETASPGSLREVREATADGQDGPRDELLGMGEVQSYSSLMESSPTDLRRRGVAAKMRAKNLFSRTPSLAEEVTAVEETQSDGSGQRATPPPQGPAYGTEMGRPDAFDQPKTSPARRSLAPEAARPRTPPSGSLQARDRQMGQSPSKATLASPGGRSKVTYSSGLRTFLENKSTPLAEEGVSGIPEPVTAAQTDDTKESPQSQRESYSDLRKRWVIEDEAIGGAGSPTALTLIPLRSLTALRSEGSQKRFLDSLEYLLAGLEVSNGMGARRSSSIEIVKRMCMDSAQDPDRVEESIASSEGSLDDFLLRLRITETQGRLWTALRRAGGATGTDEILDWALLISLARMTEGAGGAAVLLQGHLNDVVSALRNVLTRASYRKQHSGELKKKQPKNEKIMLEALRSLSRHVTQVALPPEEASDANTSLIVLTLGIVITLCESPVSLLDMLTSKPLVEDECERGQEDLSSRQCLLELLLDHLSFEGDLAATFVKSLGDDVSLISTDPKVARLPSLDVLGVAARLLETCTGPAEAQALSRAMQDICTEEEITFLARQFVKTLQFLWVFVSDLDNQKERGQANIAIATLEAASNVLADWIKLLAAFTQHSQVWCNGVLTADGGLGTLFRIISTIDHEKGVRLLAPPTLHSGGSNSLAASSSIPAFTQQESSPADKAGPLDMPVHSRLSAASMITSHDLLCYCLALIDHLVGEGAAAAMVAELQIDPGCHRHECVVSECRPHDGAHSALVLLFKLFLTHHSLSRDTTDGQPQVSPTVLPEEVARSDSALLAGCAAHTIAVCLRSFPQSLELLKTCDPNPAQALGECLTAFSAVSHAYKSMLNLGSGSSPQGPHSSGMSEHGGEMHDVDEDVERLARLMMDLADDV